MPKVYKGRFWRDHLWLLVGPGLLGLGILAAALVAAAAVVGKLVRGQEDSLTGALLLVFAIVPALVAGFACLYALLGGLAETLVLSDDSFTYRTLLYRRQMSTGDIKQIRRMESRVFLVYMRNGRRTEVRLPSWSRGGYVDDLVGSLRVSNPDIEYVDVPSMGGLARELAEAKRASRDFREVAREARRRISR